MKALVKAKAEPGIWMEEIPEPRVGPNDVLIKVGKTAICGTDMHIYNWDALGAEDDPGADGRRPRVLRRDRRDRQRGARLQARRPRLRRRPHHLRPLPQLPRRAPPPVPQHRRRRRQPPGLLRRVPGDPGGQRVQARRRDLRRRRLDLRSVRQRHAHRALVRPGRRGRADHRRRPDRHHGRRRSPATSARATSSSPTSTTTGSSSRARWARRRAVNVTRENARRDDEATSAWTEGFDVGLEMSGNAGRVPRDAATRCTTAAASRCSASRPTDTAIDWNQVIFKGLVIKGIYGREMFETWYKMSACCRAASTSRRSSRTACRSRNIARASRSCAAASRGRSSSTGRPEEGVRG